MAQQRLISRKTEQELAQFLAQFTYDFYGFIMAAYPWGQAGTPLERHPEGPEIWQKELADKVSQHALANANMRDLGLDMVPWQSVRASGHGVGKSAMVAWICQWLMTTRPDCRGTVTAATGVQLETRTWPELAKWHSMLINRHWFTWTASSYYFAKYPEEKRKNYMLTAATVSPENTEAFAGLHNETSAVLIIMDEMSGIDEKVIEVAKGALTDGEPFFFGFGNPTKPDGPFFDCFHKLGHLYDTGYIDSRSVRHTNKTAIARMIEEWGEDDDRTKYRVYGQFPSRSYSGYLVPDKVDACMMAEVVHDSDAPLILGVDVSRFGDDETVMCPRRGRDARSIPWQFFNNLDDGALVQIIAEWSNRYQPDAIAIESVGPGLPVIVGLRALGFHVHEVHPGTPSSNKAHVNIRMDMWAKLSEAISNHLYLPKDPKLYEQLSRIQYKIQDQTAKMKMETKAEMKARGMPSPDRADALVLTYSVNPARKDAKVASARSDKNRQMAITDYDEFAA